MSQTDFRPGDFCVLVDQMRPVLISVLLMCLAALGFGWFTLARADLREANIEARYPASGQMVQVGGRDVHVIVKGQGPDLVLIHGAGGNARTFTYEFVEQLSDRYRVFAVDRPGFGWSDHTRDGLNAAFTTQTETPIEQARHLAAALRKLGADTPIVLGHSYGGAVAMGWALEEPTAGVVVVSGATMPWPGPLELYYRFFGSPVGGAVGAPLVSAYVTNTIVARAVEGVFTPSDVPDDYVDRAGIPLAIRKDTFRANARQVNALRPHVVEMSERYDTITVPLEIVHGTADTTVWPSIHAEPLAELVDGANLTLLEGVGHAPHHVAPLPVIDAIDRVADRAGLR